MFDVKCPPLSAPDLTGQSSCELLLISKAAPCVKRLHHTFGLQLQQMLRTQTERFHLLQFNGFRLPLAHWMAGNIHHLLLLLKGLKFSVSFSALFVSCCFCLNASLAALLPAL